MFSCTVCYACFEVVNMTYAEWYNQYLKLYKRKIAAKTRESYSRLNQLISPVIGAKPLEAITPDDIQTTLIVVEEQAGSRQAQLAYTLMHAVYRRAVRSRHLKENPVEAVDKPEHVPREGRAIEGDDWIALEPIISANAAYALMCFAGLRRGETLALRRADIDLCAGIIHVSRQRIRVKGVLQITTPKSSAGVRDIPIAPELRPILEQATRFLLPNAMLVPIAPETLAHRWKIDQEKAGIRQSYRLHDLRHTYATKLVLAGINPSVLQYVVGHASYTLTMKTYTHVTAFSAQKEVSRVYESLH